MSHSSPEELPQLYAIRILPRAEQEIRAAFQWFVDQADISVAQMWRAGLQQEIASLATWFTGVRVPALPTVFCLR